MDTMNQAPLFESMSTNAVVIAVSAGNTHDFSKPLLPRITLLQGLGVEGDAHCGAMVKHRSRVARDPHQPNLRQVHLIQAELFEQLAARGHRVAPGQMGENITTRGLDLLSLPADTVLRFGAAAIRLTGLRNPCHQIDRFQPGLMAAVLDRAADGSLVRKAGVMGVALEGGAVSVGDAIEVVLPVAPHRGLQPV
jgi:MOSC domain-containing protein YiiM